MKKILALLSIVTVLFSCQSAPQEEAVQEEKAAEAVKVMELKKETIGVLEEYTATLEAYDKVFLAPTIPGRIKDIKVEVNEKVQKGQTVIRMDDTQLTQLQVQFNTLAKELGRMDTLKAQGSISEQSYDQVKSQYDAAKANLDNLKENTIVTSPLTGIVTNRYFENNEIYSGAPNTQAGKGAIVVIEQINKLKAVVNVSARYFPVVKKGMKTVLKTDIFPERIFNGTVSLVYPTIDPATRTFTVEVTIPNGSQTLRPGMYSEIQFSLGEKEAIIAPSAAVLMLEGTSERYVYVVEDNKAKRIKVTIGERFDDQLEIISDEIKVGDQLIVSGQAKLDNGDELNIVE